MFIKIVYVNDKFEVFMYRFEVKVSVYDKSIAKKPNCCFLWKKLQISKLNKCFAIRIKVSWNIDDSRNLFLKLKPSSPPY